MGAHVFLAAAAVAFAAAVITAVQTVVAAVAEQEDQDDDPANITATETVVTHKNTSKNFFEQLSRSFHGIPAAKKCAADAGVFLSSFGKKESKLMTLKKVRHTS